MDFLLAAPTPPSVTFFSNTPLTFMTLARSARDSFVKFVPRLLTEPDPFLVDFFSNLFHLFCGPLLLFLPPRFWLVSLLCPLTFSPPFLSPGNSHCVRRSTFPVRVIAPLPLFPPCFLAPPVPKPSVLPPPSPSIHRPTLYFEKLGSGPLACVIRLLRPTLFPNMGS